MAERVFVEVKVRDTLVLLLAYAVLLIAVWVYVLVRLLEGGIVA